MNQYILNSLSDYSIDEERLKILAHTPFLFQNFHALLTPIKSPQNGGFMFIKGYLQNYDWNRGLGDACLGGHIDLANLMIHKGADNCDRGLYNACLGGHLNLVNLMINKGVTKNVWDWSLQGACEGGHLDIANLMIEKGADFWNWGLTYACRNGQLNLMKLMIEKGATYCDHCYNVLHVEITEQIWGMCQYLQPL